MSRSRGKAATYNGGINRANLMLAARAVNKPHPLALSGITTQINGVEDAYLIEGGRVAKYVVKDPKQLGTLYGQGVVINKEGALQTYKKLLENSGG